MSNTFLSFNIQPMSDEEAARLRAEKDCKKAMKSMRNRDKKG